jgi:hypothetical protein
LGHTVSFVIGVPGAYIQVVTPKYKIGKTARS